MFVKNCFPMVLAWLMLCAGAALAQVSTATISGAVNDPTGAVIPGATVSIKNVDTGITRTATTDAAGHYTAPQLPVGSYEVTAEVQGFQSVVRRGITLTVGREAVVNFSLQVGAVAERVTVTGEAPLIETTASSVSGLVTESQMRDLPLNARSYEQLALLQPNVYYQRNATSGGNAGFTPKISAGGMRTAYNLYLEDGIDIADTMGQTPGSAAGQLMGVETLREFRVLTNNYTAQYGNALGAVVDVVSRGGTNNFHGTLFEFLRNDKLDARNFFDPRKPAFRRNQFGGILGGPIVKDRAFFFSSYEAMRQRLTTTETVFVPTAQAHQGILPDSSDPTKTITLPVNPAVRPYLDLYPIPQEVLGAGIGRYGFPFNGKTREDFVAGRVDYRFSDNVSYFGRYRIDDTFLVQRKCGLCIDPWAQGVVSRNHLLTFGETRILSPRLINDFRFGFVRNANQTQLALTGPDPKIHFPGTSGAGIIQFTTSFGVGTQGIASLGAPGRPFEQQVGNTFEWLDSLSYVAGPHTVKIGFNLERFRDNVQNRSEKGLYRDAPIFQFQSLEQFLLGQPRTFGAAGVNIGASTIIPSAAAVSGRVWLLGMYFQDEYRLRPNFTVNLGVRYESLTPYVEENHRFIILNDLFGTPKTGQKQAWAGRTCAGCVDPRIGLAWDIFSNARTVLKMGFGVFRSQLLHFNGYYQIPAGSPGGLDLQAFNPSFPDPTVSIPGASLVYSPTGTGAGGITVLPRVASVPSGLQWNLTIDQQVSRTTTLRLAYVGSHGYHLDSGYPTNGNTYEIRPDGSFFFPPGVHRIRPDYGDINHIGYDFNSYYNGFTVTVGQRASHGLGFEASYGFSRATDDSSLELLSRTHLSSELRPPDGRRNTLHGLSGLDMRHRFVANVTYAFPSLTSDQAFFRKLLSGWEVSSIITVQAGTPLTPWIGFDRANTATGNAGEQQRPSLRPGFSGKVPICPCEMPASLGGGIQKTPQRYFNPTVLVLPEPGTYGNLGRNTVIGPGLANLDFALVKNTAMTERLNLQFRAEGYNLLNNVNWIQPSASTFQTNGAYSGNAGVITGTSITGRQIQFALKLVF